MTEVKEAYNINEITQDTGGQPVAGHYDWARKKIKAVLKSKAEGKNTYTSLDEVAAKYSLHAR